MKKRVLLIVESMSPLGPAHQLSLLARHLVTADFEVHIAVLNDRQPNHFSLPSDCQVHHLEIQKRDWLAWQKLRKLAQAIQPSICHDWSVGTLTRAAIGDCFPQISSQYKSQVNHWRHELHQWWVSRTALGPIHYVASHQIVAESLGERGVREENVTVIPPAVDFELSFARDGARQFILDEYGLADNSVIVGTYAPLVPAMRIKDLIWAIDLINCIRDDVQLLVMGNGSQLNRLQRFLRCTAAMTHVHFIGCPTASSKILAGLDVYWNSHLQWPSPPALLNAMQFGVPAVSVHGAETDGIVVHQTTGFSVNVGARDEFARWTKYLIEQKEGARQIASQGQQHVRQEFQSGALGDAYLELYEAISS
ncbi:glycosyltransferase [bacterium]|nr:glycosyltransferase [bacterium]